MKPVTGEKLPIVYVFLLAVMLFSVAGCGNENSTQGRVQPPASGEQVRVRVDVVSVRTGDLYIPIRSTGTVTPIRESRVSAKVPGRILRMTADEGGVVIGGELLAELESREFVLGRDTAAAQLAMGKASLNEAVLNLEHVAREKERYESLYERQVVSRQRYDDLVTAQATTLARVEALTAQVRAASASLELAERNLADSRILAPFSGYLAKKMANQGEVVSAGMPLFWLMDIDRVRTEVRIPETDLSRVSLGIPVDIEFDGLPNRIFEGTITEINSAIDPVSRNFTVKIEIPNEGHQVKPGMFARVTMKTGIISDIIVVPERALVSDSEGNSAVFVLEESRARLRRVTPGIRASLAEIRAGITVGEQVLISGNFGLADDTEVTARTVDY